jgi:outer membrane murein-binding lipoprotein Lpp
VSASTSTFRGFKPLVAALLAGTLLAGCVVNEQRPMQRIAAERATTEVAADELLDVGVRLFDPNVPADEQEREKQRIYPEVRKAESRYIPVLIRDTLEDTGQWGQVRVLPRDGTGMEVFIDGRIVQSDGRELKLDVVVTDAAGRTWFRKTYEGQADTRAYKDVVAKPRDPFENVYNTLANDLLAARRALSHEQRVALRRVADLRFAADLAPYAFGSYLAQDRKGLYSVTRLPADDDPVVQRMQRVRERDYALVDTLNEYYANFGGSIAVPYTEWRKYTHEELEAEAQAKREALTRQVLGAVAVVGGIMAGAETNSSAGSAAATAAVIGGMYAFKSGLDKRAEIKIHTESLKQLGDSFQSEVQPMVVDVEGRTLQLKGSAEEQYAEWRRLLRELYENETGLPAASSAAVPPGRP